MQRGRMAIDQQTGGQREEPVWGAPQPGPQRWSMRETVMAVSVAVVIAGFGGAAIFAATGSHTQQAFAHEIPGVPPGGGFSAAQMTAASPALHGEIVVADGKGGFSTLLTQIGTVTAISPTAVTVRSEDAFTQSYELPATHADRSIVVSEEVSVQATRTGQVATATSVNARSGPGGPDGPPGPAAFN
jgi:hypothetical protein